MGGGNGSQEDEEEDEEDPSSKFSFFIKLFSFNKSDDNILLFLDPGLDASTQGKNIMIRLNYIYVS